MIQIFHQRPCWLKVFVNEAYIVAMASEANSEDDIGSSLPDSLPLPPSPGTTPIPDEIILPGDSPAGPMLLEPGDTGIPEAVAPAMPSHTVRSEIAEAAQTISFELVPSRKRQRSPGRGRGRGRPRASGICLVPPEPPEASAIVVPPYHEGSLLPTGWGGAGQPDTLAQWAPLGSDIAQPLAVPKVPKGQADLGQPQILMGFARAYSDTSAVVSSLCATLQQGDHMETDEVALVRYILADKSVPLAPVDSLACAAGIPPWKFQPMLHKAAAILTALSSARVAQLEAKLLQYVPRSKLLHYVEGVQYDETPMKTRVRGSAKANVSGASGTGPDCSSLAVQQWGSGEQLVSHSRSKAGHFGKLSSTGGAEKILQTRGELGMVLEIDGKPMTVTVRTSYPLQIIESTSGVALRIAQQCISPVGRGAIAFQGCTRAVTTDAASGNLAAESQIAEARGKTFDKLHLKCGTHGTAGMYGKVFSLHDAKITGVIRVALALRAPGAMHRLRVCIREEIKSRLQILVGEPPLEAIQYKRRLVQLFVQHGRAVPMRQTLLAVCPNGDWRKPMVQHYVLPGTQVDPEIVGNQLAEGMIAVLAASQPSLYNRSKWTGSDIAVDELGIFEAVHRLLSTSFARFAATYGKGSAKQQLLNLAETLRCYDADTPCEICDEEIGEESTGADKQQAASAGSMYNIYIYIYILYSSC